MDGVSTAISLFQFAVDTLGYIQLAREFKDDFETHQLKLDIIQLRLSRWGEIAGLTITSNPSKNARSLIERSAGSKKATDKARWKKFAAT
ncbi:hypothetical protein BELL_0018g00010 [Botrytis elliptica]|uniref:Prion-inhibition and propagation HeLo domain-containing protein n=1 Tax=Botrytis elliptica TaxID=278938 RepID=A0A4Z1K2C2_9HELO|nr:hypothetical protein BELL_0018g00010 [Botrytis elliptica]